jgi:5-methylcytosine-specific restriction protein A
MPSRPPLLKQKPRAKAWATTRKSRQARGYGRDHERMRELLLRDVVLCEECARNGIVTPGAIADHIVPLAQSGTSDRSNYQLLCRPCDRAKLAADSGHGKRSAQRAFRGDHD